VIARKRRGFSYIACTKRPLTLSSFQFYSTITMLQGLSTEVDICELLHAMKLGKSERPAGKRTNRRQKLGFRDRQRRRLKYARDISLPPRRTIQVKLAVGNISRMRLSAGHPVTTRELPHYRRRVHRVYLHAPPDLLRFSWRTPVLCAGFQ